MSSLLDKNNLTCQHLIANHFGYSDDFTDKVFDAKRATISRNKPPLDIEKVAANKTHHCVFCGNIFPKGILGKDLFVKNNLFVKASFNESYKLYSKKNKDGKFFICGPCLYNSAFYNIKKDKNKIINIAVFNDRIERFTISAANNTMYEYIMEPQKEDFIMLVNTRTKIIENIAYLALPSVANSSIVTIVYGTKILYIDRNLLRECLEETIRIMDAYKINKNLILNTVANGGRFLYFEGKKIKENEEAKESLFNFFRRFDRDTRIIATKLLDKHIKVTRKNNSKEGDEK